MDITFIRHDRTGEKGGGVFIVFQAVNNFTVSKCDAPDAIEAILVNIKQSNANTSLSRAYIDHTIHLLIYVSIIRATYTYEGEHILIVISYKSFRLKFQQLD